VSTAEPNSQEYPVEATKFLYPTTGNFIAIVSNESSIKFLEMLDFNTIPKQIDSCNIVLQSILSYITASDNISYWNFGFNAIMLTDTAHFRNKNYHTSADTIETIDFPRMQYSVDLVVESIKRLKVTID
jgi:hypothetical protein